MFKNNSNSALSLLKSIIKNAAVLIIMILPGLFLDAVYKGLLSWGWCSDFLSLAVSFGNTFNISYTRAFELLRSNMGLLVTIVSLFLTMNTNISTRSEQDVFGISRRLLNFPTKSSYWYKLVKYIRIMVFAAPLLMILFINITLCVSGYLLILYCFAILFIHIYYYSRSYDKDEDINLVAEYLIADFDKTSVPVGQNIISYQSVLENIHISIIKNNEWKSAEKIYYRLIDKTTGANIERAVLICCNYFQFVLADDKNKHCPLILEHSFLLLNKKISEYEKIHDIKSENECLVHAGILFGIFHIYFHIADENFLIRQIEWFLDFSERSRQSILLYGESLPLNRLQKYAGILLVFTELWLENNYLQCPYSQTVITHLWEKGKKGLTDQELLWNALNITNDVYAKDLSDCFQKAKDRLLTDFTQNTERSMVTAIISIGN